jgi:hypothetical protein
MFDVNSITNSQEPNEYIELRHYFDIKMSRAFQTKNDLNENIKKVYVLNEKMLVNYSNCVSMSQYDFLKKQQSDSDLHLPNSDIVMVTRGMHSGRFISVHSLLLYANGGVSPSEINADRLIGSNIVLESGMHCIRLKNSNELNLVFSQFFLNYM